MLGTAIFVITRPVSVSASLTSESVPAEKRWDPSGWEKARERQEPLCRCVDQAVLIVLTAVDDAVFFLAGGRGGGDSEFEVVAEDVSGRRFN